MVVLQSLYNVLSISSCSLFLMMMMMNLVLAGPTGLTLKLIHRDSPESPLYPGNLTKLERLERAFQQSIYREQKLLSTWQMKQVGSRNNSTTNNNSKSDIDMVRPKVNHYDVYTYMVQLGIGTFSNTGSRGSKFPNYYNFYLDTGSDLLWLQCDPSFTGSTEGSRYFRQDPDYFDGQYSITYSPFPYNSTNPICEKYVRMGVPREGRGFCGYSIEYADGSKTEGVLATEKLTVNADNGGLEEIKDYVFGCGFRQVERSFGQNVEGPNPIAGILGLGGGKESFIVQLGDRAQNKFEYCLKPMSSDDPPDSHTFLRFGSDTKIVVGGQGVQTTGTFPVRGETLYYVTMVGISVNEEPVVYSEPVFTPKQDGTGGCIFDSGTDVTLLSAKVYAPFREHLITYFSTHGMKTTEPRGKWKKYDLCFPTPDDFDVFPIIKFHFSRAVFEMEPETTFTGDEEMICLIIRTSDTTVSVVLGSFQQVNHRILHDVRANEISWINEDCATDS